jgi:molybdopterin-binding protein
MGHWPSILEGKMKLSARNILKGKVVAIDKGQVAGIVTIDIGGGKTIISSVTLAAIRDLGLKKGSEVSAIIKASQVLLGIDD